MNTLKDAILLRALGLLDEDQARALERARESDPVVRHWSRLLDPNAVEPPQPLVQLADELAAELAVLQEREESIPLWTAGLLAADRHGRLPPDMLAVKAWQARDDDPMSTRYGSELRRVAKSKSATPKPLDPLPEPPYVEVRDEVLLAAQRETDIPFALVRVLALHDGKPFHSKIVVMRHDVEARLWRLELPLTGLFEGDLPDGEPDYTLQAANATYTAWFPRAEVERILKSIPASFQEERERVEQFLEVLKSQ